MSCEASSCTPTSRFRRLRWLIATPEFHHWHHSDDPTHYDNNYSLFSWLDRIFGTAYLPEPRATTFGVPDDEPGGYLRQLWEPFQRGQSDPSAESPD